MTNANDPIHNSDWHPKDGLTKREYFAAMAMQGYLASYAGKSKLIVTDEDAARWVRYADQLINALNKQP